MHWLNSEVSTSREVRTPDYVTFQIREATTLDAQEQTQDGEEVGKRREETQEGGQKEKMKEWWRPLSAIIGVLTFVGVFIILPMSTNIDSLKEIKADSTELDKKADKDVFELTVKNIEEDIDELKEGQKLILQEIRKLSGGGE